MRFVVSMSCVFAIVAVATYFYQDHESKLEAVKAALEQKMSAECPDTLPGRILEHLKALNEACRAQGYID